MDHGSYDEHQAYCESVSGMPDALLQELDRITHIKCIHPRMLSGRYLGRVLSMISTMLRPERILEIGTYTGYSALCLAEGLSPSGSLLTLERDDELASIQQEYFSRSPYTEQIETRCGQALDILPGLEGPYDLIFLDADKENYIHYLPQMIRLSRPGSHILIDNMLWEGKVLSPEHQDPQTESIRQLTTEIAADPRLTQVLLPVRDGLMVVRVEAH